MNIAQHFESYEECAFALFEYLKENKIIAGLEHERQAILQDIYNLRGYEWLEGVKRNSQNEGFFAFLCKGNEPWFLFRNSDSNLKNVFIYDEGFAPDLYWEIATGESGAEIPSLEDLRQKMDEAGLGDVWDYPMCDVDEAVANNEHLVLVESYSPSYECRIFEVTDEMFARYEKMYGNLEGRSVSDIVNDAAERCGNAGAGEMDFAVREMA